MAQEKRPDTGASVTMSFEDRVSLHMLRLNDVEDDIVDYLRQNAGQIGELSINKIAKDLYICPNTVVRLARKLGYRGFSELKYSLASQQGGREQEELKKIKRFLEPELSKHILRTVELIDKKLLRDVLGKVYSARRVALFGMGDSQYFCELLAKYLSRVSDNIEMRFHILMDSEYSVSRLREGDVAIFISSTGESPWIIELAEMARKKQAFIIAITTDSDNTLRRMADRVLLFSSEDKYFKNYNVPDLTGLMLLIRYIANTYWNSYLNTEDEIV